jgi:phosphoribosylanthranilate isomerase
VRENDPMPTANLTEHDEPLADTSLGPRVKVCGVTEPREIELLANERVDFAGVWYGVPGGPHDLPLDTWQQLTAATAATGSVTPVFVTFLKDIDEVRKAVDASGVRWVQLHGYPTPGFVRAVKSIAPEMRVIKVLHVRGAACLEERLIPAYEKAGVDVFLFDVVTEDGRVGSTGELLNVDAVTPVLGKLSRPFLLAGGVSPTNRAEFAKATATPNYLGVDVDTNARGADGKIDAERVGAITQSWKAEDANG